MYSDTHHDISSAIKIMYPENNKEENEVANSEEKTNKVGNTTSSHWIYVNKEREREKD